MKRRTKRKRWPEMRDDFYQEGRVAAVKFTPWAKNITVSRFPYPEEIFYETWRDEQRLYFSAIRAKRVRVIYKALGLTLFVSALIAAIVL